MTDELIDRITYCSTLSIRYKSQHNPPARDLYWYLCIVYLTTPSIAQLTCHRMVEWLIIWWGRGNKQPWHTLSYYSGICLEGLPKTTRRKSVSGPRFELRTSWMWSRSSTSSFDVSTEHVRSVRRIDRYLNIFEAGLQNLSRQTLQSEVLSESGLE
jgi:hypothetical protein